MSGFPERIFTRGIDFFSSLARAGSFRCRPAQNPQNRDPKTSFLLELQEHLLEPRRSLLKPQRRLP